MKKKLKSFTFILILSILFCPQIFCQPQEKNQNSSKSDFNCESFKIENSNDFLYIMTLENGLTVFVREDYSSALVHFRFSCRAGISNQTKFNSGFIPLYTNLLAKKIQSSSSLQNKISVKGECNAKSSNFTADFSPLYLNDFFNSLGKTLKNQEFSDSEIKKEYESMKENVKNYAGSTAGFINSAIDSRIFYEEPWKTDSGIYPALFASYTPQEVRTILYDIENFYSPKNCAVFISGNISFKTVYELCKNNLEIWKKDFNLNPGNFSGFSDEIFYGQKNFPEPEETSKSQNEILEEKKFPEQKKFVLISNEFSPEITQIVIQYENLSQSEADILSAAWNSFDSNLKSNILSSTLIAVRSADYIGISSAQGIKNSRLIIQSLIESPESLNRNKGDFYDDEGNLIREEKIPIVEQTAKFLELTKKSAHLSRKQFVRAQNEIYSKYKNQNGNALLNIDMISNFWAENGISNQEEFYKTYQNFAHKIQSENEKSIEEKILSQEPYVFLLVNSKIYDEQKNSFLDAGYNLITKENASWYENEMNLVEQKSNIKKAKSKFTDENYSLLKKNFAEDFYKNNAPLIKNFSLKNGIPVFIKENPQSQDICVSIAIYGGEMASPKNQKLLRTVLINAFAKNIQGELTKLKKTNTFEGSTNLKAWTEETCSYITIECLKDDIQFVLEAAFNAVIYGDVSPVSADSLVSEQSYQWRTKNLFLTEQMKNNALSYLFRGSEFQKLFSSETPVLESTTYNSISLAYTQLLDASLYSIVIAGGIKEENAKNLFKTNFELLLKQSEKTEYKEIQPQFKNKIRNVQLVHTFTTNLPAYLAPKESPLLVPTTEFFDPAQFYFAAPQDNLEKEIFNSLLFEFEYLIKNELGENAEISSFPAKIFVNTGMIQSGKIKNTDSFLAAYKNARKFILKNLNNQESSENENSLLKDIKSAWTEKNLSKTSSSEGTASLIQKGLLCKNPSQYLENYVYVSSAGKNKFLEILEKYFEEEPLFKVYSVNSKKTGS